MDRDQASVAFSDRSAWMTYRTRTPAIAPMDTSTATVASGTDPAMHQERASAEGKEFVANASDVYIPAPASLDGSSLKQQDYVDNALHVTAVNGSPSFLITMTLDVNHPDITENLGEGQTANTRPDVTAMVAHRAFERLLYFVHGGMLGANLTTTATVEWQARGLPHLHLIVTNERQDRVLQAADADHFTTCEAPDNNDELLNLVAKFMQHKHKAGECCEAEDLNEETGELHDKNARCKQGFPRPLAAYTHEVDEGGELLLKAPPLLLNRLRRFAVRDAELFRELPALVTATLQLGLGLGQGVAAPGTDPQTHPIADL